jgi:hypothetical protein
VFGYLLLPEQVSPTPAIVCLPGHGRGCDDIVGIAENGEQRASKAVTQMTSHCKPSSTVTRLSPSSIWLGCRRDDAARKKGALHRVSRGRGTALWPDDDRLRMGRNQSDRLSDSP